jgi:integration host factor alpha subunit
MTKAEVTTRICEKARLSKEDAINLVQTMFEIIKASLEAAEQVKIGGFGTFGIRTKRQRKGRNPQTGAEILIPQHRVLTFKPSFTMKKAVNSTGPGIHHSD